MTQRCDPHNDTKEKRTPLFLHQRLLLIPFDTFGTFYLPVRILRGRYEDLFCVVLADEVVVVGFLVIASDHAVSEDGHHPHHSQENANAAS
jgi:hypothetical protein